MLLKPKFKFLWFLSFDGFGGTIFSHHRSPWFWAEFFLVNQEKEGPVHPHVTTFENWAVRGTLGPFHEWPPSREIPHGEGCSLLSTESQPLPRSYPFLEWNRQYLEAVRSTYSSKSSMSTGVGITHYLFPIIAYISCLTKTFWLPEVSIGLKGHYLLMFFPQFVLNVFITFPFCKHVWASFYISLIQQILTEPWAEASSVKLTQRHKGSRDCCFYTDFRMNTCTLNAVRIVTWSNLPSVCWNYKLNTYNDLMFCLSNILLIERNCFYK